MVLGARGRFTAAFRSTGDEDSFTVTIVLENTHQTTLVTKSSSAVQTSVARDGVTIPHDAPLPAGKYTVTLTGTTPSGEWKERDPEG
jgi:hypothetical protein